MPPDWSILRDALRRAQDEGRVVRFWWRDDDAVAATPDLARLTAMAEAQAVPVHIAVIPALLEPSLTQAVVEIPFLVPVVHGWRHADTSEEGQKKSEFQRVRPDAAAETAQALATLQNAFGPRLVPLFVPPWNRIAPELVPELAAQGYRGLSTFGPRTCARKHGLHILNTHIDPIFWRGDRGLVNPDQLIKRAAAHIDSGTDEPLGLLTHHLVHTPAVWDFTQTFLTELRTHGARPLDLESALR